MNFNRNGSPLSPAKRSIKEAGEFDPSIPKHILQD